MKHIGLTTVKALYCGVMNPDWEYRLQTWDRDIPIRVVHRHRAGYGIVAYDEVDDRLAPGDATVVVYKRTGMRSERASYNRE